MCTYLFLGICSVGARVDNSPLLSYFILFNRHCCLKYRLWAGNVQREQLPREFTAYVLRV